MTELNKDEIFLEVQESVQSSENLPADSAACLFYALHAIEAIKRRGVRAIIQAGTARWPMIRPEQDDGVRMSHFSYEWTPDEAPSRKAVLEGRLPEMHAWVGLPESNEIVDLTTGYWPIQAKKLGGFDWPGDRPPLFFWGTPEKLPPGVFYIPKIEAMILSIQIIRRLFGVERLNSMVA